MNYDPATTLATFSANTAIGTLLNATLDQLSLAQFPQRAPITAGRTDIEFNGTEFVYVAPPVVEEVVDGEEG